MFGRWVAAALGLAVASAPVWAGDDGPQTGQFFVTPFASYYYLPEDEQYKGSTTGFGGAIGWAFRDNWIGEVEYLRYNNSDVNLGAGQEDSDRIQNTMLNFLYLIPSKLGFQPYLLGGGGRGRFEKGALGRDDHNTFDLGAGFFKDVTPRVSVRADVRGMYVNGVNNDLTPMGTLGLAVKLGALAPKTEPDADGDGVPDARDKCPGTPAGRKVDVDGCELDSDGDGVVDGLDACPDTPRGVKVDSRGCPPPPPPPAAPAPVKEPVRFDLTVEFAFNSAEINDLSFGELRKAMQFLRDHPNTKATIEGHTDNRGADAYNQKLSERRAAAVLDVVTKSGIDRSRLSSVGYGESRPIASNDTDEGRQRNRRVSIVVAE